MTAPLLHPTWCDKRLHGMFAGLDHQREVEHIDIPVDSFNDHAGVVEVNVTERASDSRVIVYLSECDGVTCDSECAIGDGHMVYLAQALSQAISMCATGASDSNDDGAVGVGVSPDARAARHV